MCLLFEIVAYLYAWVVTLVHWAARQFRHNKPNIKIKIRRQKKVEQPGTKLAYFYLVLIVLGT